MKQPNHKHIVRAGGYLVVLAVLLLGAVWIWFTREDLATMSAETTVAPHTNFRAPAFALNTPSGDTHSNEHLQGKIIVLNFWATWCPPCRAEMPALDEVQRAHSDKDVVILGVNQMEDAQAVATFAREFNLTFPLVRDADGTVSARYQVSALPTTFFIDRRGVIRNVVIGGSMSREFIENQISALLQEPSP